MPKSSTGKAATTKSAATKTSTKTAVGGTSGDLSVVLAERQKALNARCSDVTRRVKSAASGASSAVTKSASSKGSKKVVAVVAPPAVIDPLDSAVYDHVEPWSRSEATHRSKYVPSSAMLPTYKPAPPTVTVLKPEPPMDAVVKSKPPIKAVSGNAAAAPTEAVIADAAPHAYHIMASAIIMPPMKPIAPPRKGSPLLVTTALLLTRPASAHGNSSETSHRDCHRSGNTLRLCFRAHPCLLQ